MNASFPLPDVRRGAAALVHGALLALVVTACGDGSSGGAGDTPGPIDEAAFKAQRLAALELYDSGRDDTAAVEALLAVHAVKPDLYGINKRLGEAYADQLLHAKALRHFLAAAEKQPGDKDVRLAVVKLQLRLGEIDAALAGADALVSDRAIGGEALYIKAQVLDQEGRRDEALAALEAARELAEPLAYRAAALHGSLFLEEGDFAAAVERCEAARRGRPDYREALKGLADAHRRLGSEDEAAHWDHVLELFLILQDDVFMKTAKRTDERIAALEEVTRVYPVWQQGFRDLADAQVALGERAAACATIERLIAEHGADLPFGEAPTLRRRYCGGKKP